MAAYLLIDPEDDKGVDFEFISEAVKRFDEDESVKPAFITAVEELSVQLSQKNINDDYKPYTTVRFLPFFGCCILIVPGLEKSCSPCIYRFSHHRIFYL